MLAAAGGCAIEKVLFPPFRSGAAHIVIFRTVFSDRPIPHGTQGRAHKPRCRTDGAAEQRNHNGCTERNFWHVTRAPREKIGLEWREPNRPPHHYERPAGPDLRARQLWLDGS